MKAKILEEVKKMAKDKSLENQHKDEAIHHLLQQNRAFLCRY